MDTSDPITNVRRTIYFIEIVNADASDYLSLKLGSAP